MQLIICKLLFRTYHLILINCISSFTACYLQVTISHYYYNLSFATTYLQVIIQNLLFITSYLQSIFYNSLFVTHHSQLIIYNLSFTTHYLQVIIQNLLIITYYFLLLICKSLFRTPIRGWFYKTMLSCRNSYISRSIITVNN